MRRGGATLKRVNIVSWHREPQVQQLSNLAAARFAVVLEAGDLMLLGFSRDELVQLGMDEGLEIDCGSVEGILQSLKARSCSQQTAIAASHGKEARLLGRETLAEIRGGRRIVFFLGKVLWYAGTEHRALIEWAIRAKFAQDAASRSALLWTGDAELTHNMGRFDAKPGKTSLPKQVFVRILRDCREILRGRQAPLTFPVLFAALSADRWNEAEYYRAPQ